MEKRTLLALALSFAVIGLYPYALQKIYPEYYKKKPAVSERSAPSDAGLPADKQAPVFLKKGGELLPDEDMAFTSERLSLVFNKKDGGIRQIAFPAFADAETKRPLLFLSAKNAGGSAGALAIRSGGDQTLVTDYSGEISQDGALLSAVSGGITVTKRFDFSGGYAGELALSFQNNGAAPMDLQYEVVAGSGIGPRHSIDAQYIEANFFSEPDGKPKLEHVKENRAGKQRSSTGPVLWAAAKDRHFSVIAKPEDGKQFHGLVRGSGNNDFTVSLVSPAFTLQPGAVREDRFKMYAGPNELELLSPAGLQNLINFGKFDPIGRLFVGALELLFKLFKNYGVAIIVLTALINLLLFPLTRVSYMSMKRMQLIQPQMSKLRENNKKNPEKLNREMMELYKKHKVNPFGGCLPMIVQIPIFIALYVALSKFVPLINSKFLWVKDLSSPDRVYLPFNLPFLGNFIHVLPLLMVGAMVLQQKMTQIPLENQDPAMAAQQRMMAFMMPLVFGFVFYQMPSGLVLYWLTNTLLMFAYQLKLKNMKLAH